MKTQLITLSLLLLGLTAGAQQPYLSREAYRDKVEAYSQILKQQKLKTMASTEARKIAHTGFLPKIDVNADGTLNMSDLNAWNEPVGEYRNHTYQGVFIVSTRSKAEFKGRGAVLPGRSSLFFNVEKP